GDAVRDRAGRVPGPPVDRAGDELARRGHRRRRGTGARPGPAPHAGDGAVGTYDGRPMTMTNVEVIRSIYDDWLSGGLALDKFDPEISMIESSTLPGGGASASGIAAVRRYMESF